MFGIFSGKARREEAMLKAIQSLILSGQESETLSHIYYEAASGFAKENGANMSPYKNDPDDDTLIFYLDVFGEAYHICVQRWKKDDTFLTVTLKAKQDEKMKHILGRRLQ